MGASSINVYISDLSSWCVKDFGSSCFDLGYNLYLNGEMICELVIPDDVTSISSSAFERCKSITSVVIGDNVTDIGVAAFAGCPGLTSITLGQNISEIDINTFAWCTELSSVYLTDNVIYIRSGAFRGCTSLTSVRMSDSIEEIFEDVFSNCPNIVYTEYDNCLYLGNEDNPYVALITADDKNYSRYEVHDETKIIADYAFGECSRLSSLVLPDSITHIGHMATGGGQITDVFYSGSETQWADIFIHEMGNEYLFTATIHFSYDQNVSTGLEFTSNGDGTCYVSGIGSCTDTSIVIPDVAYSVSDGNGGTMDLSVPEPVVGIGLAAFENCKLITEVIIPDSIVYISEDAFNGCSSLKSISIPDGVSSIGSAFQDCSSLESILLPKELTRIEVCTFAGCTGLKEITVQDKLEVICENAFSECTSLKHLYYTGSADQWLKIDIHTSFYSWLTDLEMHCEHTL